MPKTRRTDQRETPKEREQRVKQELRDRVYAPPLQVTTTNGDNGVPIRPPGSNITIEPAKVVKLMHPTRENRYTFFPLDGIEDMTVRFSTGTGHHLLYTVPKNEARALYKSLIEKGYQRM